VPLTTWAAMPRSFDVSTDSSSTVEEILRAFGDERYWLARLEAYGGDTIRLDGLTVDGDGAVSVTTSQDLRRDVMPGVFARFFPGDLAVLREETWRPVDGGQVHGDVRITASGAPASGSGTAVLAPIAEGSTLRFTGSLEIRIPLIGGTIEKIIRAQLAQEIPLVQLFTTNWIAEHA
jgi:uncharacterized protein DUF2505